MDLEVEDNKEPETPIVLINYQLDFTYFFRNNL